MSESISPWWARCSAMLTMTSLGLIMGALFHDRYFHVDQTVYELSLDGDRSLTTKTITPHFGTFTSDIPASAATLSSHREVGYVDCWSGYGWNKVDPASHCVTFCILKKFFLISAVVLSIGTAVMLIDPVEWTIIQIPSRRLAHATIALFQSVLIMMFLIFWGIARDGGGKLMDGDDAVSGYDLSSTYKVFDGNYGVCEYRTTTNLGALAGNVVSIAKQGDITLGTSYILLCVALITSVGSGLCMWHSISGKYSIEIPTDRLERFINGGFNPRPNRGRYERSPTRPNSEV